MSKETDNAEVFDFSEYKLNKMIIAAKRNPKVPQANIITLQAVLDLYLNDCIVISWVKGEPYMSISPEADIDENELKEKFNQIIAGS